MSPAFEAAVVELTAAVRSTIDYAVRYAIWAWPDIPVTDDDEAATPT